MISASSRPTKLEKRVVFQPIIKVLKAIKLCVCVENKCDLVLISDPRKG